MLVSGETSDEGTMTADLAGIRLRATVVHQGSALTVFASGASHRLEFEAVAAIEEEDPSGRLQ